MVESSARLSFFAISSGSWLNMVWMWYSEAKTFQKSLQIAFQAYISRGLLEWFYENANRPRKKFPRSRGSQDVGGPQKKRPVRRFSGSIIIQRMSLKYLASSLTTMPLSLFREERSSANLRLLTISNSEAAVNVVINLHDSHRCCDQYGYFT
jgi:hypothetical protein